MVRIFPRLSDLRQLSRRGLFDLALAGLLEALLIVLLSPILLPLWVIQILRARARELSALRRTRRTPAIPPPAPW